MINWLINKIIAWSCHLRNDEHCKIMDINPYREVFIYWRRNGNVKVSITDVTRGNKITLKGRAGVSIDERGNISYTGEGYKELELQTTEVKTQ